MKTKITITNNLKAKTAKLKPKIIQPKTKQSNKHNQNNSTKQTTNQTQAQTNKHQQNQVHNHPN